jgi:phosphate starvation-inducible PhoH-like protein
MKMFLTRIGFGSKVIITGDLTQKDLPSGTTSGLDQALDVLGKVEDIGIAHMTNQDVVRHPLVQQIVKAYDDYDKRMEKQRKRNQFKENRGAEHRKTGHR